MLKFSDVRRDRGNRDPKDVSNLAELVLPKQWVSINFDRDRR